MRLFVKFPLFWGSRDGSRENETRPLIPKEDKDPEVSSVLTREDTAGVPDGNPEPAEGGGPSGTSARGGNRLPVSRPFILTDCLLKYLLIFSNLIFSVVGLVTLALGLWGLAEKESLAQEKIGHIGTDPMLLFITLGLMLSLLCLSGCVGAVRENECLLQAFSAGLLVLVSAQVLAAIVLYTLQGQIEGYVRSVMLTAISRYQDDLDFRFIVDEIQTGLQCCGADTYQDWEINIYFNCSAPGVQACGVPASCCIDPLENGTVWNSQCGLDTRLLNEFSAQSVVFLGGCLGGAARWIERHAGVIGTVEVVFLGVQVLSTCIAMRQLDNIRRTKMDHW
ncbi:tetraspanin-10 [Scleropages formosus]|uniref:tetraspanin-10 n=1 Tax=Scleropages formosus TaxID=113540 RepID=UPI0010FAC36E|nr:tetraspanin-10 [Scleropages formosus]